MRVHVSGALALAAAAISSVAAQDYGDTTFLSLGYTYTAALDADGDPIAPALATAAAVSTTTRTRGGYTVAVAYDSDEDPLFTSTLTAVLPTTTTSSSSSSTRTTSTRTTSALTSSTSTGRGPIGGAAGGGAGPVTTSRQASLQKISGYTPPLSSAVPSPTAYRSGSIIKPDQIPGYSSFASSINKVPVDGRPVYGGGGNKVDGDSTSPAHTLRASRWAVIVFTAAAATGTLVMV